MGSGSGVGLRVGFGFEFGFGFGFRFKFKFRIGPEFAFGFDVLPLRAAIDTVLDLEERSVNVLEVVALCV